MSDRSASTLREFSLRRLESILLGLCCFAGPAVAGAAQSLPSQGPGYTSFPLANQGQHAPNRFTLLGPTATGVDFIVTWRPAEGAMIRGIGSTAAAAGVCIGDYDDDGLPDLFLTRPFGGNRLYRNLGNFRFADITQQAGMDKELEYDAWGAGPCFIDIDNDRNLDLYLCSQRRANRLYINQGDGTFVESAKEFGLDYSGASITMAFADYDRDGDLDAYLVTNWLVREEPIHVQSYAEFRDGRQRVAEEYQEDFDVLTLPSGRLKAVRGAQLDHFYRNDDGKFVEATREVLGNYSAAENFFGHAARWFDYDEDGYPDLHVANDFYGPDQLFHNNGDGTMTDVTKSALPHVPWYSMGSDAGDVNNDGLMDLMASDMAFTTHLKATVNRGSLDKSGWFLEASDPRQQISNALYLNTGTDRFQEAAALVGISNTDWTWAIKFADFDCDGWLDLYITNGMTRSWFDSDLRERAHSSFDSSGKGFEREWEDVWKNEPPLRENNLLFRNRGDLRFDEIGVDWGLNFKGVSFGSAVGDLDGDGDLDIVTVNFEDQVHIYRNEGTPNHRIVLKLRGVQSNRVGIGTVVKVKTQQGVQVRDLPSVRGFLSADEPSIFFGLGDAKTVDRLAVRWPSGVIQTMENLPTDRRYVITEQKEQEHPLAAGENSIPLFRRSRRVSGVAHKERPFNDFNDQPLLPYRLSRIGPGIACADVDGDGRDDFYLAGAKGTIGRLMIADERGFSADRRSDSVFHKNRFSEEMAPLFLDVDGDGDQDLFVVNGSIEDRPGSARYQDRLYLNAGDGAFAPADAGALPDLNESGSVATAADFDRDGDLDIFVGGRTVPGRYPEIPRSALLRNEGGRFTDVTEALAPGLSHVGMVTSAIWSDANGDGWLDLVVTCEWGPVRMWRNKNGRLTDSTEKAGLTGNTGWWNGIAAGDLDCDGDVDFAVTNIGLNSKYRASHGEPAVLYYGDMDGNGSYDIVEAAFSNGTLLPVRGRSASTAAIPVLAQRCPTFRSFGLMNLDELYGRDRLLAATRLEATCLESGVLLNDGAGVFHFMPLPRIAQIAPGFGPAVLDVNADGNNDIYFVQNFYSRERETVRMDGGVSQLLLGNGRGEFRPLPPHESGLVVPGDAKALAVIDLTNDDRPDFLISNNNGDVLAFENQGRQHRSHLCVRLIGLPGNPSAVGALVTVTMQDGSTQSAEVYCGGGYLSQSTSRLFFGYSVEAPPRSVQIRWPTGEVSNEPLSASTNNVSLHQPESSK